MDHTKNPDDTSAAGCANKPSTTPGKTHTAKSTGTPPTVPNDFSEMSIAGVPEGKRYKPGFSRSKFTQATGLPPVHRAAGHVIKGGAEAVGHAVKAPFTKDPQQQLRVGGKKAARGAARAAEELRSHSPITNEERKKRNRILAAATTILAGTVATVSAITTKIPSAPARPVDISRDPIVRVETPDTHTLDVLDVTTRTPAGNPVPDLSSPPTTQPAVLTPNPKLETVDGNRIYTVFVTPETYIAIKNKLSGYEKTINCLIKNRGRLPQTDTDWDFFSRADEKDLDNFTINGVKIDKVAISFVPDPQKSLMRSFDTLSFVATTTDKEEKIKAYETIAQISQLMNSCRHAADDPSATPGELLSGSYNTLLMQELASSEVLDNLETAKEPDPVMEGKRLRSIAAGRSQRFKELADLPLEESIKGAEADLTKGIRLLAESIVNQSPIPPQLSASARGHF